MNISSKILLVGLFFFLCACAGPLGRHVTKDTAALPPLKRIAVLPMDRASVRPGEERPTCSLSDTVIDATEVSPDEASAVTGLLFSTLRGDSRFITVPEGRCVGFLNSLLAADVRASTLKLIRSFGRELGVEAVLYGKLYRFKQRVGGSYSVKTPASVAFSLHLIRVSDGCILWNATFDETQKPLSENLFKAGFYKKTGIRWLTAEELAAFGLSRAIDELRSRLP